MLIDGAHIDENHYTKATWLKAPHGRRTTRYEGQKQAKPSSLLAPDS